MQPRVFLEEKVGHFGEEKERIELKNPNISQSTNTCIRFPPSVNGLFQLWPEPECLFSCLHCHHLLRNKSKSSQNTPQRLC